MNSEPAARDLLAAMPAVTEDQLRALRDRLADRADADGVLDVAYRTIDTPVGTLLLAATAEGLVRVACHIRPLAYGIQPQIGGNTVSFDLDRPRYLLLFFNDEPAFYATGLMLFAEPTEKNPPRLGDPNVVNIQDYKVDSTGKTL